MNRLIEKSQNHITVNGREVPLITNFRNALITWDALSAVHDGDMSPLAASYVAIECMLELDGAGMDADDINEAVKGIADYLQRYARISDREIHDNRPPLLDLQQDGQLIYDGFQKMGIDLDAQDISYPRFMSLLREMPSEAVLCRIIYLRQQHQSGKLTKEEKAEIKRRGTDVVFIRNRQKEKEAADNAAYFRELQRKKRAERGLPQK